LGRTLLDEPVKVVLTSVAPNGKFKMHRDKYSHLFYFLGGQGIVRVGEKKIAVHPGVVVQIMEGEDHAYENTGDNDLVLISLNLPPSPVGKD
jgi:quercetin dioxygenase-like cupin family protein